MNKKKKIIIIKYQVLVLEYSLEKLYEITSVYENQIKGDFTVIRIKAVMLFVHVCLKNFK